MHSQAPVSGVLLPILMPHHNLDGLHPEIAAIARGPSNFSSLLIEVAVNWRIHVAVRFTASATFNFCRTRFGAASQ
jgi:hypothetical protein